MPTEQRLEEFSKGRIGPLLLRYAWPALVTMSLSQLYNVVDRIYIGQGCGSSAMAGLALTFPFMMIMGAFGAMIGVGSGALLSIKLGENDRIGAEKVLGQCVALKLLLAVTVVPVLMVLVPPLLHFMASSASPQAVALARQYLWIVLPLHVFAHLAFGLAACMRSEGSPNAAMMSMVIGTVANIVLDPIFIFVFEWGVAGAAWATNLAMLLSCLWTLGYYASGRAVVKLRLMRVKLYPGLAVAAISIGLSPFSTQLVGALVNLSMNRAFSRWDPASATLQIAAFSIFQPVAMMFFMPSMGIQQGLGPVVGYNWGAGNNLRVRRTLLLGLKITTALCFVAWAAQLLFAPQLARAFSSDRMLIVEAARDIRLGNCLIWCIGLNVVATTYFQSVGRPLVAILLSLLRQFLCLLPCIWLLPRFFPSNPVLGVWISLPVSDVLAFVATIPPIVRELRGPLSPRGAKRRSD